MARVATGVGVIAGLCLSFGAGFSAGRPSALERELEARVTALESVFDSGSRPVVERPPTISLNPAATMGVLSARVALVEYADFNCPYCVAFRNGSLQDVKKRYIESGQVQFSFKHLPLVSLHPFAESFARAAECAGRQDRFWLMHDALFLEPNLDESGLVRLGKAIVPDLGTYEACLKGDGSFQLTADAAEARAFGFSGTPAFVVGLVENAMTVRVVSSWTGNRSFAEISDELDRALVKARSLLKNPPLQPPTAPR